MFLMVTVVAVWLGWELKFIRERQAWLRENASLVDVSDESDAHIPWWRKWLGDEPVPAIVFPPDWTDEDCANVARLFPEAVRVDRL